MKARDLKNITVPITLGNNNFKMAFDFNALAELEEVYGDLEKAMRAIKAGKGRLKAIRALVYAGIKPRHQYMTLVKTGELLTEIVQDSDKAEYIINQLEKAIELAMPSSKEDKEQGE